MKRSILLLAICFLVSVNSGQTFAQFVPYKHSLQSNASTNEAWTLRPTGVNPNGKLKSNSIKWQWDSIITYDTSNAKLQMLRQTFDAHGNVLTQKTQNWQNNAWVTYGQETYTYDANGNMVTDLYQSWQNNAWVNTGQDIYTYDANGNRLTYLEQVWQNNAWVNGELDTYTYDTNGNMLNNLSQQWQNNAWLNWWQYTYTYDAKGNMLTALNQYWQNNAWLNYSQYTYTYDANGNSIRGKDDIWGNGNWQPVSVCPGAFNLYVYSNKNVIYVFPCQYRYEAQWESVNTGVNEVGVLQSEVGIAVYPNPVNQLTIVNYQLTVKSSVSIKVYDMTGQEVETLVNEVKDKGNYSFSYNATHLRSGVYFVKLTTEGVGVCRFVKE